MFLVHENTIKIAILQDNGKSLQGSKERNNPPPPQKKKKKKKKKKKSKTSFLKVMNILSSQVFFFVFVLQWTQSYWTFITHAREFVQRLETLY